jgi:HD-GYP domain-containing protein (c-di-GMP phosphodiesterase class II)
MPAFAQRGRSMASSHRDEISRLELLHAAHPDGLVFPHLADAYRRAGRYSQAEVVLTAGLRRHADYSSAHVVLGRLRLDQGKRDQARAAFERVIQLDPRNQVALAYLGELALEEGRLEEALARFRTLQRYKQDEALERRIEDLSRQVEAASSARPADAPDAAAPAGWEGDGTGGRGEAGSQAVVSASAPEPGEVVTETIAELYERQGLKDRAVAVYRELLRRNPSDDRLRGKLERLLEPPAAPGAASTDVASPGAGIRQDLRALLGWSAGRTAPVEERVVQADPLPSAPEPPPGEPPSPPPSLRPVPRAATQRPTYGRRAASSGRQARRAAVRADTTVGDADLLISISDLLVGLLEYRDPFFRGGSSLTRLLAVTLAEELGLSEEQKTHLALAAILRDLGRLALGGRLVPMGRATHTPDARRYIERHVDLALQLLDGIALPTPVREAVRHHHERWDGTGYPDALAGENVPLLARVLAVADSFGAMVSPRTYRVPLKAPDAVREMQEEAGTRYDPSVVEALVRILQRRDHPHLAFAQRQHVVLMNPDMPDAVVTATKLCAAGYLAEVAGDIPGTRDRLRRAPVAALVITADRPDEGILEFVRGVRAEPMFGALPIVAVGADGVAWRVDLLEAGADVCFPPGVTHAELQGTLGALVRRTLRRTVDTGDAGADTPWLALQGDLQDFPMTWLLQVMKYDGRTAAIAVRSPQQDGVIYLREGDAVHAQIREGPEGEVALRRMLRWETGRFTVHPDARPREETIQSSIMHLLLMQAVDEDHASMGVFGTVSPGG